MGNIRSMTGYATRQTQLNESELTCEIRTLNSRFLEISLKLPKIMTDLENPLKEIIRKRVSRGKVFCSLSLSSVEGELQNLKIDQSSVKLYLNLLQQIRQAAGIDSPITLEHLLTFKDIISFDDEGVLNDAHLKMVFRTVDDTLQTLNEMRSREGENLKGDLLERLEKINKISNEITELAKNNPQIEFERLQNRLVSLLDEEKVDQSRLEQELAILTDRVDITEENVRMKSHLQLFRENIEKGSPIGKKLNFILQEMHRETNTISNKNTMIEISHRVVTVKEEIEKLREQIQNIE